MVEGPGNKLKGEKMKGTVVGQVDFCQGFKALCDFRWLILWRAQLLSQGTKRVSTCKSL